jgi:hypothetical protein
MMDALFTEAIKQLPGLVVLTLLVIIFVKDRAVMTGQFIGQAQAFQTQANHMFNAIQTTTMTCRGIQDKTGEAMRDMKEAVQELTTEINRLNGSIHMVR